MQPKQTHSMLPENFDSTVWRRHALVMVLGVTECPGSVSAV